MTTRRLQTVYVKAPDMAASRGFYETVLGLGLKFADGDRWVQYDAGGTNFALASTGEYPAQAAGAVPVFEVTDLDARVARLVEAGIAVLASADMGSHGRTVTLVDPAGQYLQLFQRSA